MKRYKSFLLNKSKEHILECLLNEGILTYGDDFQSKLKSLSRNRVANALLSIVNKEFDDKDLEQKIRYDIQGAVEGIELKLKEKEDNKQARTMKKMEREQRKLQKEDAKLAKQHAKTMKNMEKKKAKEDKEFSKLQKAREAEFKKMEA
jgi:TRAP-type mannitol/chloroaromatic compound transport system substrate-binding protein